MTSITYVGKENAQHLINAIESKGYKLSIDWTGGKYYEIALACTDNFNARVHTKNVGKIQT